MEKKDDFLRKVKTMRHRSIGILVVLMSVATLLACTPVADGLRTGVTDGLNAASATFIEELAAALVGDLVPDDGE